MALPALLGAGLRVGSRALARKGGRAAVSKLIGRKTRMQPGKTKPGGQEVGGERGALE